MNSKENSSSHCFHIHSDIVYLNQKQYICSRERNMVFMETPNLILWMLWLCILTRRPTESRVDDLQLCLHIGLCHLLLGSSPGQR